MNNFQFITQVDHKPLLSEVLAQPELWNKNPCRMSKRGPHYETEDIFIRYKDETENMESGNWLNFSNEHLSEWYKSADLLPSSKKIVFDLFARMRGEILGGVFVYRVRPGQQIYPHIDKGWHPTFYDKFNVCLQSNPKAKFCYEGAPLIQSAGDVHQFRNDVRHWVINEGETDHIVMIVCMRLDKGYRVPWSPNGWDIDQINTGE